MNRTLTLISKLLGVALLGALLSPAATAQCAKVGSAQLKPQAWVASQSAASFLQVSDYLDPIVGMWHVQFTASGNSGIPDGTVIDDAFVVLHSDGTEIMNSSRDPETQSFCLGVWSKTATRTYKVNHFTISWDGVHHDAPLGPGHIQETIYMNPSGVTFTGTFAITQYDQSANVIAAVRGNLSARRISVNTPASSLF